MSLSLTLYALVGEIKCIYLFIYLFIIIDRRYYCGQRIIVQHRYAFESANKLRITQYLAPPPLKGLFLRILYNVCTIDRTSRATLY